MVDTAIEADEILDGGAAVKTGKKAAKKNGSPKTDEKAKAVKESKTLYGYGIHGTCKGSA